MEQKRVPKMPSPRSIQVVMAVSLLCDRQAEWKSTMAKSNKCVNERKEGSQASGGVEMELHLSAS